MTAIQFISEIKENAITSSSTSASVLASASKELPREIISYIPKIDSLKRTIQRVRKKQFPTLRPNCVEELTIPDIYQITDKKEKFLYFDSGSKNMRVLVFCTEDNLKILKKCSQWYADGTFKSAPPLFNQFFVIHGKLNDGSIFPLIYSLMTHRTEQAYDILFNFLADELGEFEPESIMTDFEIASRKSYNKCFPSTKQRGCYFHLMKAIWKKIQTISEMQKLYKENIIFSSKIRYFASLAFIPPSDVCDAYEKILKLDFFVKNNQIIFPFLTYFEETWIGTKKRGRRYPPLFPIPLWNVYEAIQSDWDKTNNICEGFNNGFAHLLSAQHPSIYKFINGLRRQQNLTEMKISQSIVGNPNTPNKRNKTVSWAERVKKVVADYHNREFEDYLQGISLNIYFH